MHCNTGIDSTMKITNMRLRTTFDEKCFFSYRDSKLKEFFCNIEETLKKDQSLPQEARDGGGGGTRSLSWRTLCFSEMIALSRRRRLQSASMVPLPNQIGEAYTKLEQVTSPKGVHQDLKLHIFVYDSPKQVVEGLTILWYPRGAQE